ncbi:MAG: hypothetical protein V4568_17475 [Pseudomonadota bacterium]
MNREESGLAPCPHSNVAGVRLLSAGAVLISLALHAVTKGFALLPEMLWACHVASFLIAIGILFQAPKIIATGFLFHVGLGLPGYFMDVIATGTTTPTSILVHFVPPIAGGIELWRSGFPKGTVFPCVMLYPILVVISYWATDATLNINLAHAPWAPVASVFPQPWISWGFNTVVSFFSLMVVERILRRMFPEATVSRSIQTRRERTHV